MGWIRHEIENLRDVWNANQTDDVHRMSVFFYDMNETASLMLGLLEITSGDVSDVYARVKQIIREHGLSYMI